MKRNPHTLNDEILRRAADDPHTYHARSVGALIFIVYILFIVLLGSLYYTRSIERFTSLELVMIFLYIPIYLVIGYLVNREMREEHQRGILLQKVIEANKNYRDIVDNAPIGIYTVLPDGEIESFNPKMVELAGATTEADVVGLNVFELQSYKDAGIIKDFQRGLSGHSFHIEVHYVSHTAHKESYRRYHGTPIFADDQTGVQKLLLMVEDITQQHHIEQMRSEFVSIASHQMRTPLAGMKWFSELLLRERGGKLTKKQRHYIEHIYQSNERLIRLINDLLDVTRLEAGKYKKASEDVRVLAMLQDIVHDYQLQADQKKIQIQCHKTCDNQTVVKAETDALRQAIGNLIDNAIRYSNSEGVVEIDCRQERTRLQIRIQDHGIGIPKAQQERLFERFFRAENAKEKEPDGSGLGLSIAQNIIVGFGGTIEIESQEGIGTTVVVTLPIKKRPQRTEKKA